MKRCILHCGVCGEEHWHYEPQSEIICLYCEEWAEKYAVMIGIDTDTRYHTRISA